MFANATSGVLPAFDQILLLAGSSLLLKCDCADLALHLDADLQSNCSDIAFKMPGSCFPYASYYPNLLNAYEFEFPSEGLFQCWPCMQFLLFDFQLLGKRCEVVMEYHSMRLAYLVSIALYPLDTDIAV